MLERAASVALSICMCELYNYKSGSKYETDFSKFVLHGIVEGHLSGIRMVLWTVRVQE